MLITRETDYALRILRALLDGELHTAGELSDGELIPQQFAYKILRKLSRVGLVQVSRGVEGGCRLAADLDRVSLYDLIAAMEESYALNACMDPGYHCPWREKKGSCNLHNYLCTIQKKLVEELRSHSLAALLREGP